MSFDDFWEQALVGMFSNVSGRQGFETLQPEHMTRAGQVGDRLSCHILHTGPSLLVSMDSVGPACNDYYSRWDQESEIV